MANKRCCGAEDWIGAEVIDSPDKNITNFVLDSDLLSKIYYVRFDDEEI